MDDRSSQLKGETRKRKIPAEASDLDPSTHRAWSVVDIPDLGKPIDSSMSWPSLKDIYDARLRSSTTDFEPGTKAIWANSSVVDYDSAIGQASTPPTSVRDGDKADNQESDSDEGIDIEEPPGSLAEVITPSYEGFKAHVRRLNPEMDPRYDWLVSRIAHQQAIRYKSLLDLRVRHSREIRANSCSSGKQCIALGGRVIPLDRRGNIIQEESGSTNRTRHLPVSDDEDSVPDREGRITRETFPAGMPMPPTTNLPAEFECQLCFRTKRILKPSDWTKHVHEDLQPFTCTFDKCKEPKSFKRMADWVRHENERHRHLEWWICQIDDCGHPCYRKENFLQHLVREHKIPEPRQKTKAAIDNARNAEPAWIMLEKCQHETEQRPQDEPCKFCGKTFPTWKKLTVHLAKHMEHISLPIIVLIQTVEVDADTIIEPIGHERYPYPGGYPSPASTASPFSYGDAGMSPAASSPYSMQYSAPQYSAPQYSAPQSLMMRQQMGQSRQFGSPLPSYGFHQPVDVRAATRRLSYPMAPPWDSAMESAPSISMPGSSTLNQMFGSGESARGPGAHSMYSATPAMQTAGSSASSRSTKAFQAATSQESELETRVADVSEALEESSLQ